MFKEFVETGKIERLEELRADFLDRSSKKLGLVLASKLLVLVFVQDAKLR